MPNLIKIGSAVLKVGINVMQQNRSVTFGNQTIATISGLNNAWGVVEAANKLFVKENGKISIFSLGDYSLITSIVCADQYFIAVDEVNGRIYARSAGSNMKVFDLNTYAFIRDITIPGNLTGIDVDPVGNRLYAVAYGSQICVFSLTTYAQIGGLSATDAYYSVRLDVANDRFFWCSGTSSGIGVGRLSNLQRIGTIAGDASQDLTISPWNNIILTSTGKVYNYVNPTAGVIGSFSPAGNRSISCDDTRIFKQNVGSIIITSNSFS